MLDLPCCCDHAAAMCNDQHALDGVVTVRFSTTVIADGLELAGWLERSIGPQGGCWDIMLDMEADTLSWRVARDEHRVLFQLTWGYGLA